MIFEYSEVRTCTEQIDIDDIGNCCLISNDLIGCEYFLVIQTILGVTQIVTYGPIVPDSNRLPSKMSYYYDRFDFNEQKIIKTISKFCSNASHIEMTTLQFVKDNLINMIDTFEDIDTNTQNTNNNDVEEF